MSEATDSRYHTHRVFSPGRIWAIAWNTFTQLVRMRVFYFLLIFAVIIIASTFLFLRYSFEQELKLLKDVSFGAMNLFSGVFAVVGTALLIPKDIEERTLYTILSKPVPRLEYLMGKLLGMLILIAISLFVMTVLFFIVLYFRQNLIVDESIAFEIARTGEASPELVEAVKRNIAAQGVSWNLLNGVVAILLKAAVAASMTLVISTVASTTLFTILVSLVWYFIGHVQAMARAYWFSEVDASSQVEKIVGKLISIGFPDFQLFNIVDGVAAGAVVPAGLMLKLVALTLFYLIIYKIAAWLVFADKEL